VLSEEDCTLHNTEAQYRMLLYFTTLLVLKGESF